MGIQQIRLTQIKANIPAYKDFEQQLISMFGDTGVEKFASLEGQKVFKLEKAYTPGKNALKVFVNGVLQILDPNMGYLELNSKMIAFCEGLYKDDIVVILHNNLSNISTQMANERVKPYNIYRKSNFITEDNKSNLVFETPSTFILESNALKVYKNGILLLEGESYDYIEQDDNHFKLINTPNAGDIITCEVITGGLDVYRCNRYTFFIDELKTTQRTYVLPTSYKVGGNTLKVYLNGFLLRKGVDNDYTETDDKSFTLNYELNVGDRLEVEITAFTVDVFDIRRVDKVITNENNYDLVFTTVVPYTLGEGNLRIYLNGVLLREGVSEDYTEVNENTFRFNFTQLPIGSIVEYEITTW